MLARSIVCILLVSGLAGCDGRAAGVPVEPPLLGSDSGRSLRSPPNTLPLYEKLHHEILAVSHRDGASRQRRYRRLGACG